MGGFYVRVFFLCLQACTEGYTGAEMVAVCREAALAAMEEDVFVKKVKWRHYQIALQRVRPQTTASMLRFYKEFKEKR